MSNPEQVGSIPTHHFARLNPFRDNDADGDSYGQQLDFGDQNVAGGGHAGVASEEERRGLRVSHALRAFLGKIGQIGKEDVGEAEDEKPSPAVEKILMRPEVVLPAYISDRSHPLPHYWISSSHNTYLTAKQLYGKASTQPYENALAAGARCVEIDAWDNEKDAEEPKVTHGLTLTTNIPFRSVCEAINKAVSEEVTSGDGPGSTETQASPPAPVMISLENHCSAAGQLRLANIMKEVFGDKLVTAVVDDTEKPKLQELNGKIVVMVEYYGADLGYGQEDSDTSSDDDEVKELRKKRQAAKAKIIPELSALGIYAHSIKPTNDAWLRGGLTEPLNPLVNVSESQLAALLTKESEHISTFNSKGMMRVYPKGLRINSKNLMPVPFWNVGAQVCALNWQTFDASMQLNEATFVGSDGYVLKPPHLRGVEGVVAPTGKFKLTLRIAGASDLPVPEGRTADDIKPYISCVLHTPSDKAGTPAKRKTQHYRQHKHTGFLHHHENPIATDPIYDLDKDGTLVWDDQPLKDLSLTYVRMLVKSDDSMAKNPLFAVAAVRLEYASKEWHFVRLLDLKGRATKGTLLVQFQVEHA